MSLLTGVLGVVLFLIGSPAIGQLQLPNSSPLNLMEFQVISQDGVRLPFVLTSLVDGDGKGISVVSHCFKLKCVNLRSGHYKYALTSLKNGSHSIDGSVFLSYPTMLITVMEDSTGGGVVFHGRVQNAPNDIWLHASSVFTNYHMDAKVEQDGKFVLHGIIRGKYIVVALDPQGNILASEELECCSGRRLGEKGKLMKRPQNGAVSIEFDYFRPATGPITKKNR